MPKLTKEETINALEAAILKHEGRKVTVDQKGSWYKIDGEKSLRFGDLESMLQSFDSGSASDVVKKTPKAKSVAKVEPKTKTATKAKKTAVMKTKNSNGGKLPKEFWLDRLTTIGRTFTLPRGF